jgi:hypothetical protein
LLFIECSFGVYGDKFVGANNAVMYYIRAGRVFNTRAHDNRCSVLYACGRWALYPRNLALHSNFIALKTGQTITVNANLPIDEVDKPSQDI